MENLRLGKNAAEQGIKPSLSDEFLSAVMKDFYSSFYHSQSKTDLQTHIFVNLAKQYQDLFPKSQMGTIYELRDRGFLRVAKMNIPFHHIRFIERDRGREELTRAQAQQQLGGFREMWSTELHALEKVLYGEHWLRRLESGNYFKGDVAESLALADDELLRRIALGMVEKDLQYQDKQRPVKREGEDLHESYFRNYAIEGHLAQTPRFNTLYAQLSDYVLQTTDVELKNALVHLANLWEKNHPGQRFFLPQAA